MIQPDLAASAAPLPGRVSPSQLLRERGAQRQAGAPDGRPRARRRRALRAVWISDLHLGTPGCKARELLAFLAQLDTERLYLVGDIIDGWSLARQPFWPAEHQQVLERFFALAESGTEVVYVTGNHDEELRALADGRIGRLKLTDLALHTTADGRRLVVLHGDQFDGVTTNVRWLAELGDRAYALTLAVNTAFNRVAARIGLRQISFSLYLKQTVKAAVGRVNRWDTGVAGEIARHGAHGLICGHVHKAEIANVGGALYLNDGDWVESRTALVEQPDGALVLGHWNGRCLEPLARVEPLARAERMERGALPAASAV